MKKRIFACLSALLIASAAIAADVVQISSITKDSIDKIVTVSGTITKFTAARSETAPNSFILKDATGQIRVAIWKDQFSKIAAKDAIKSGAQATVEGKVKEFRNALEIHVRDPEGVKITEASGTAASAATTASVQATTASAQASRQNPPKPRLRRPWRHLMA